MRAWLPQKELLHHPNVKLFITHGGTSSIKESLYATKPLLFASYNMAERYSNGLRIKAAKCGDIIDSDMNDTKIQGQITELIANPMYKRKCEELKEMMMVYGGTKNAVKMVNYVNQYGTKHLIPVHSNELSWHQTTCIDIYVILIVLTISIIYGIFKCIKCICCCKKAAKIHDKAD